jgi:thiol:disulfide interchange protein
MKILVRAIGWAVIPFAVLGLATALLAGCSERAPASDTANNGVQWVTSLEEGLKQAAEQDKPLMVDFYTDWCGWCKELDRQTYSDARVQDKAKQFVSVKVDAEADATNRRKYGVDGFPTIIFLDSAGTEIHRVPGFAPPDPFLKEMDKALAKAEKS